MPRGPNVAVCTATFSKMWLAGTPTRIISETLKISADKCDVTRRRLGLPRRESWHGSKAGHRKAYIPTPDEIRQKCLAFQAGWSDEERARRCVGWSPDPKPVEVQTVSVKTMIYGIADDNSGWAAEDLIDTSGD
jgi:hypothetical protein